MLGPIVMLGQLPCFTTREPREWAGNSVFEYSVGNIMRRKETDWLKEYPTEYVRDTLEPSRGGLRSVCMVQPQALVDFAMKMHFQPTRHIWVVSLSSGAATRSFPVRSITLGQTWTQPRMLAFCLYSAVLLLWCNMVQYRHIVDTFWCVWLLEVKHLLMGGS